MKAKVRGWRGSRDGPWPVIRIEGELEAAEREWLHTNSAGAYSMSTLALMHTRREHGIFVAPLDPPLKPHVIVGSVDVTVELLGRSYRLATHQFPEIAPTPGYRYLKTFAQDPLPRWVYRLNKSTFSRTLSLVRGQNAVVLSFTFNGTSIAKLKLRPQMPLRPTRELMHEHGAMVQNVTLRSGQVEVQPVPSLPPVVFGHEGVFMGSPDWWRRFEYSADRSRYSEFCEDQWTPGEFEIELMPRKTTYLVIALGSLPAASPEELVADMREHLLRQDPGATVAPGARLLRIAANDYCADLSSTPGVVSGYPWSDGRTFEALMSVPGLFFESGRTEAGERVLRQVIKKQRIGFLPDKLDRDGPSQRPCLNATLWLFEAARALLRHSEIDADLLRGPLYFALLKAFARLSRGGDRRWAWLSAEGLLIAGAEGIPLTWMDGLENGTPTTPRSGLPVELQALWTNACDTLADLAGRLERSTVAEAARNARDRARAAFKQRFWCNETNYPFDCLSAQLDTVDAWADPSIRPNALFALAMDRELFEPWQAGAILERVQAELLTAFGIRTLSPKDPNFVGRISGTAEERRSVYHQGATWPFLLRAYCVAKLRDSADPSQTELELSAVLENAANTSTVLGHVCQLTDGVEPYRPRGCPAHAASVSELLRAFQEVSGSTKGLDDAASPRSESSS